MRIRTRKLVGTIGLLVLVTVWALLAMGVAQFALRAQSGVVVFAVLCGRGHRLGPPRHAADQLDVASGQHQASS